MSTATIAIVGAGLAGAKAAEALRIEGFAGRIVLFGAEPHRPYERPPLSKDYLQGRADRDAAFVHPADWYAQHRVELRLADPVTALDPAAHRLSTRAGEPVHLRQAAAQHRRQPGPAAGARRRAGRRAPPAHASTTATRCAPRCARTAGW